MAYQLQPWNFQETGKDYGSFDLANALQQGIKTTTDFQNAQYNPQNLAANLLSTQLNNKINQSKANYADQSNQADINQKNAMANFYSMGGGRGGVDQGQLMSLQHQLAVEYPGRSPIDYNRAASAYISGDTDTLNSLKFGPASGIVNNILDSMTKHTNTAQAINQQRFAKTTDSLLDQGSALMPAVSKYSGLLGKAQGTSDAVQSSLGKNSQDYSDYIYFTRQLGPSIAGEMMRAMGANASDQQKSLYRSIVNPNNWDSNPQLAQRNYNQLVKLFKETISPTIAENPNKIRSDLKKGGSSNSAPANLSDNLNQGSSISPPKKTIDGREYHQINGKWLPYLGA